MQTLKDTDMKKDDLQIEDIQKQNEASGSAFTSNALLSVSFSRIWAMPNHNTFDIPPIATFVKKYLYQSAVSIDPFARNKRWATYTNDLNPETDAEYHMEARDFLKTLADKGVKADLLIFDPPYSPRQVKECYDGIGRKMQMEDGQTSRMRKEWKDLMLPLLTLNSVVLSFGWNTVGMGLTNGFEIMEIMLCCHGADHNDTICMAERKTINMQQELYG